MSSDFGGSYEFSIFFATIVKSYFACVDGLFEHSAPLQFDLACSDGSDVVECSGLLRLDVLYFLDRLFRFSWLFLPLLKSTIPWSKCLSNCLNFKRYVLLSVSVYFLLAVSFDEESVEFVSGVFEVASEVCGYVILCYFFIHLRFEPVYFAFSLNC